MSDHRIFAPALTATLATTLLGASLALSAPAFAQSGASGQSAQGGSMDQSRSAAKPITDEQIEKFNAAQEDVHAVREQWQDRMHDADDKKAAMQNRQKANQKMVEAIQDHGLSVAQYNHIIRAAQSDPKLAQRIQQNG